MAVSPTLSVLTALLSPTTLPSDATPTTEDPLQRHFSAIVGVPVGIGLAILILSSCALYLFLSAYIKHRREEREQATNTTNVVSIFHSHHLLHPRICLSVCLSFYGHMAMAPSYSIHH
ncbi:hypothetical protein GBAR_LOCUS26635 [Geodia barretti]|uniref:Uncharacterized protein n=1 Tax=Geodia barretti TaxID=519541 RepID=A0AA35THR8_GEOBA|nr:hypothetical protein GBAR_LOCUS26635 [Geodia barretti]